MKVGVKGRAHLVLFEGGATHIRRQGGKRLLCLLGCAVLLRDSDDREAEEGGHAISVASKHLERLRPELLHLGALAHLCTCSVVGGQRPVGRGTWDVGTRAHRVEHQRERGVSMGRIEVVRHEVGGGAMASSPGVGVRVKGEGKGER